jgi:outer membrane beta-barrel protein
MRSIAPTMHKHIAAIVLLGLASGGAFAQGATPTAPEAPAGSSASVAQQPIVPQVDRRPVKPGRIPSNDFELGLFTGTYATQNFGSNTVSGIRAGYHITEDFFFEAAFGRTKVSDEAFRSLVPPGGFFGTPESTLSYYNISIGANVLPGEAFIGRKYAKATALYLIFGTGSTKFATQKKQTFNYGFGYRVMLAQWASAQLDVRDHVFSLDLLGRSQRTHNIEMTAGVTFFF